MTKPAKAMGGPRGQAAGQHHKEGEMSQKQAKHGAGCKIIPIQQAIDAGSAEPPQEPRCPCGAMTLRRAQALGRLLGMIRHVRSIERGRLSFERGKIGLSTNLSGWGANSEFGRSSRTIFASLCRGVRGSSSLKKWPARSRASFYILFTIPEAFERARSRTALVLLCSPSPGRWM